MKTYFIVLFKALVHDYVYEVPSNFYFKTEEDARAYARNFVERSTTFSEFEIKNVIPYIV